MLSHFTFFLLTIVSLPVWCFVVCLLVLAYTNSHPWWCFDVGSLLFPSRFLLGHPQFFIVSATPHRQRYFLNQKRYIKYCWSLFLPLNTAANIVSIVCVCMMCKSDIFVILLKIAAFIWICTMDIMLTHCLANTCTKKITAEIHWMSSNIVQQRWSKLFLLLNFIVQKRCFNSNRTLFFLSFAFSCSHFNNSFI